jgi:hypothetical protein
MACLPAEAFRARVLRKNPGAPPAATAGLVDVAAARDACALKHLNDTGATEALLLGVRAAPDHN